MITMSKAVGLFALAAATVATPAMAQTFSVGPEGVRVMENRSDRGDMRRDEMRRDDMRGGVSQREAVRIARGEGVREVEDVRLTRNAYRVVGYDRSGDDIRVDVDRRSGAVLAVR